MWRRAGCSWPQWQPMNQLCKYSAIRNFGQLSRPEIPRMITIWPAAAVMYHQSSLQNTLHQPWLWGSSPITVRKCHLSGFHKAWRLQRRCTFMPWRLRWSPGLLPRTPMEDMWQQDSAPAHMSKLCQKWCSCNLAAFWPWNMWPPSSPDLSPLDCAIWEEMKRKVCSITQQSVVALKAAVERKWAAMSPDFISSSWWAFIPRIKKMLEAEGGHFETWVNRQLSHNPTILVMLFFLFSFVMFISLDLVHAGCRTIVGCCSHQLRAHGKTVWLWQLSFTLADWPSTSHWLVRHM